MLCKKPATPPPFRTRFFVAFAFALCPLFYAFTSKQSWERGKDFKTFLFNRAVHKSNQYRMYCVILNKKEINTPKGVHTH